LPTDLNQIIKEFSQIYSLESAKKNIHFYIESNISETDFILIDEVKLRQILFNLLGNAFKFTSVGQITFSIQYQKSEVDLNKASLSIKIKDTGIGVPLEQQTVIFESFKQQYGQSTRKYGGTGLGLTITKHFIEMMNGVISLKSEEGKGSEFIITFEEVEIVNNWKNTENFNRVSNVRFKGQTVLIVEDIHSNIDIIKGYLDGYNLILQVAENGQIAIDMLETMKPDLILMDMMMPVMSGYSATKIIKSNKRLTGIPIIATTASALKHNELLISNLCDNYLRKPIAKDDLVNMLANYLSHNEVRSGNTSIITNNEQVYHLENHLRKDLHSKFKKRYNSVNELMSIDDISSFGIEIKNYGKVIASPVIINYGTQLLEYAENFEIEKMNTLFKNFNYLIQKTDHD
ncbi:MAG: ATP-binding protein, partial [Bacteroidota bacterium]